MPYPSVIEFVCARVYVSVYTYVCHGMYVFECMYVCMYVRMYVCVYICMYCIKWGSDIRHESIWHTVSDAHEETPALRYS